MKYIVTFILLLTLSLTAVCQAPQWTDLKLFAGQSFDYGHAITVDQQDNVYLALSSQNPHSSFAYETLPEGCNFIPPTWGNLYNGMLFRFDSSRNLTLSIVIKEATLGDIAVDELGNIYVSGALQYGASRDAFLNKYSATGELIWTKRVEGIHGGRKADDWITSLAIGQDGSLAISGSSYGDKFSLLGQLEWGPLSFVTKLNADGDILWTHRVGSELGYGVYRVQFDAAGDVLVTGNARVAGTTDLNATIAKLRSMTGEIIWQKQLRTNGMYVPMGTAITTTDDYYIFGGTFGGELTVDGTTLHAEGGLDIFLLQCDLDGNINWLKVAGSTERETLYDVVAAGEKIYFTGGYSDGFQLDGTAYAAKGDTDVYIGSLDSDGNALWLLTGGSHSTDRKEIIYDEAGGRMAVDSKGRLQVVGTTFGNGSFGSLQYRASEEAFTNAFWLTLGNSASAYTVYYPCNRTSLLDVTVSVYPNPFVQSLTISNSQGQHLNYKLLLTNSIGQKVAEKFYPNVSTVTIEEWKNLAAGIYFLKIDTDDYAKVFKLVKK